MHSVTQYNSVIFYDDNEDVVLTVQLAGCDNWDIALQAQDILDEMTSVSDFTIMWD